MRFVAIGLNPRGISCVVEDRTVPQGDQSGLLVDPLWQTKESPPELPVGRRTVDEPVQDADVSPTGTAWRVVSLPPAQGFDMHRTDTLDYDVVLSGEITLSLEEGAVTLLPGDMVAIPGVRHSWRAGPEGCVFAVMMVGLPPV